MALVFLSDYLHPICLCKSRWYWLVGWLDVCMWLTFVAWPIAICVADPDMVLLRATCIVHVLINVVMV